MAGCHSDLSVGLGLGKLDLEVEHLGGRLLLLLELGGGFLLAGQLSVDFLSA